MQYGLIAEDVDEVNPNLVVYKNGEPEAVQYEKLVPVLLNEIQKQKEEINSLKSEMNDLKNKFEEFISSKN
jgi:hypothetical protein